MQASLGVMVVIAVGMLLAASAAGTGDGPSPTTEGAKRAPLPNASSSAPIDCTAQLPPDLNEIHATVTPWKLDKFFPLTDVPEPSGLCYCPLTQTMFVVDDGAPDRPAGLYELSIEDCKVLRSLRLGKDLEGVTYAPTTKRLYVSDEEGDMVHVVDPRQLKELGSFPVSRFFQGKEILQAGGNSFEGIAWYSGVLGSDGGPGFLILLNQDDPTCLVWLDLDGLQLSQTARVLEYYVLPQRNSGELYIDTAHDELWVANSWLNTCEILDLNATPDVGAQWPVKRWEVLPGMAQEGIAFDPQGRLWIGQDAGGIARYVWAPQSTQSK